MYAHVARKTVDPPAERQQRRAEIAGDGARKIGLRISTEIFCDEAVEVRGMGLDLRRNRFRGIGAFARGLWIVDAGARVDRFTIPCSRPV